MAGRHRAEIRISTPKVVLWYAVGMILVLAVEGHFLYGWFTL